LFNYSKTKFKTGFKTGITVLEFLNIEKPVLEGRTPKQPVSKRPVMKFKKPNLASVNPKQNSQNS
jgi:hypothetical protein